MCQLCSVAFHGDTIFCVEHHGEPYVPMRPIVENLGLNWSGQAAKFRENKKRWGVEMISTPSDGGVQEMLCLPLRKLAAWLASINPKKVRAELRPKIELYQAESDDALWNYWMNGKAERVQELPQSDNPDAPIGPADQNTLQAIVRAKVAQIPEASNRGGFPQIWSRFNNHFRLGSYKQLPQSKMAEAVEYLVKLEVRADKALSPKTEALPSSGDKYEAYTVEVEAARVRIAEEISRLMDKGIELVDYRRFGPGCLTPFTYALADWLRDVLTRPSSLVGGWRNADNALNYSPVGIFQKMEKDFEYLNGK